MMKALFKFFLLAPLGLFCACTNLDTAGGTTETENAIAKGEVSIQVYNGDKPAKASYRVLPSWYIADTTGAPIDTADYTYSGSTDSTGKIHIENHLEGSYTIEITKGDSAIAYQYTLNNLSLEFKVAKAKLAAKGAIRGSVSVPEKAKYAWVHVPGIGRVVKTDSLGDFVIKDLPSGTLSLKSWDSKTKEVIAETSVDVQPKETVNVGHIPAPGESASRKSRNFRVKSLISDWMKLNTVPFALPFRLDSTNFDFASAKGDGSDVRVLDADRVEIPTEIDAWDSAAQVGVINIRIENMADTAATWTLEWGDPEAPAPLRMNVWKGVSDTLKYSLNTIEIFNFDSKSTKSDLSTPLKKQNWYVQLHSTDTLTDSVTVKTMNAADFLESDDQGRSGSVVHIPYTADYPDIMVFGTRITSTPHDWSHMDSLVVWIRGSGDYEIILENLDLPLNYKASYKGKASSVWDRVVIRPEDFNRVIKDYHGWEITKDKVTNFTIFAYNGTDIWIDNVRIYGINPDDCL